MNKITIIICLLLSSFNLLAQEEHKEILIAPENWGKEVIPFPLEFARSIDYEGIEDIRFAPGWREKDSLDFWSYVFVWNVKVKEDPNARDLERHLMAYFDGLMSPEMQNDSLNALPTTALIIKTNANKDVMNYVGKISTFDRFTDMKMMTLHMRVEKYYCKEKGKMNIVFRFSPKDFESEIWRRLENVSLTATACED